MQEVAEVFSSLPTFKIPSARSQERMVFGMRVDVIPQRLVGPVEIKGLAASSGDRTAWL